MGLLQKAVETYDSHYAYASEKQEGQEPMAPVSHIIAKATFEITITEDGKFVNATKVPKEDDRTVIPVSVASSSRTRKEQPHPLCDQLSYVAPFDKKRYDMYVSELEAWANSSYTHPKVQAISEYVRNQTIASDLQRCKLITFDKNGLPKEKGALIRWIVLGDGIDACWKDKTLIDAYIQYDAYVNQDRQKELDMITGEENVYLEVHPKSVITKFPKAKLISIKDDGFPFKYRGRFTSAREAFSTGVYTSQKAHNALKWLITNQAVSVGDRYFLSWNPQGKKLPHMAHPLLKDKKPKFHPTDYRKQLLDTLNGKREELGNDAGVVITAFDVTSDTTGRLSVVYYNELKGSDFLQRIHDWDLRCCWIFGKDGEINSPYLEKIINCAFGRLVAEKNNIKWDTDKKLARQWMQILITCRLERKMIPWELVATLVDRATAPERFTSQDKNRDRYNQLLSVSCAVIKKYRFDKYKEEWDMALEPERLDRSYQFGRLMAIFEWIERSTFRAEEREHKTTYAIRCQNAFFRTPLTVSNQIHSHLEEGYFPKLKTGSLVFYKDVIGSVMDVLSNFPDEELDCKLSETYLLGYYLQRNELRKHKKAGTDEED